MLSAQSLHEVRDVTRGGHCGVSAVPPHLNISTPKAHALCRLPLPEIIWEVLLMNLFLLDELSQKASLNSHSHCLERYSTTLAPDADQEASKQQ